MIDLIRAAARSDPDRPAVVSPKGTMTYGELAEKAGALGVALRDRGISRMALICTDQVSLIPLLAATSQIGCEACVYRPLLPEGEIAVLARTFGHTVVATDRHLQLDGIECLSVLSLYSERSQVSDESGDSGAEPLSRPLLVLTTGTTARPKAARYDWDRLVGPALRRRTEGSACWLLAFNLNQFAGLQVLVHALANEATIVVPAGNQPRDALRAMIDYGVTHVSATPTFWRFLIAVLDGGTSPVPAIEQATLGGEAASAQLLDDMARIFPRARVSHVYASTEAGSGVSVGDGMQGLPISVLDRPEDAEVRFRIVDGQLEAWSRVGMLGYLGHRSDREGEGEVEVEVEGVGAGEGVGVGDGEVDAGPGWRPTGDLVEIRGDRIYFVGRATETINVGGVKVHPLSVEEVVSRVKGVRLARAYGRSNPVSGQIVAVDVELDPLADRDSVDDAIRLACEILPPAAQPRRVRFVDKIDLSDNKIARSSRLGSPDGKEGPRE